MDIASYVMSWQLEDGPQKTNTVNIRVPLLRAVVGAVLETLADPEPDENYACFHESEELTALCPRTGQPDFYNVRIKYVPRDELVELRSLKRYFQGFRSRGILHEELTNEMFNDLVDLLNPRSLELEVIVNVRGGIKTKVRRETGDIPHGQENGGRHYVEGVHRRQ